MDETDIIRRVIKVGAEIKGILEGVGRDLNADAPVGGWAAATDKIDQESQRQAVNDAYQTGRFDGYAQRAHEERQKRQMKDPFTVLEAHQVVRGDVWGWVCKCGYEKKFVLVPDEEAKAKSINQHKADMLLEAGYGLPPLEKGREQALTQGMEGISSMLDRIKSGRYNFSTENVTADLTYLEECIRYALEGPKQ